MPITGWRHRQIPNTIIDFPILSFFNMFFPGLRVCVCRCCRYFCQCVLGLYIDMSVYTAMCPNPSPHTLRFYSFALCLYLLNVTPTTWLLSEDDKIPSCKDGSCPTFPDKTSPGLSAELIPDLHTSALGKRPRSVGLSLHAY